jgi:hypothetical protein
LMKHPRTTDVHKLEHTQKAIYWMGRKSGNAKRKRSKQKCIVKHGGDAKISNVKRAIKMNRHVEIDGVSATDKKSMTKWS